MEPSAHPTRKGCFSEAASHNSDSSSKIRLRGVESDILKLREWTGWFTAFDGPLSSRWLRQNSMNWRHIDFHSVDSLTSNILTPIFQVFRLFSWTLISMKFIHTSNKLFFIYSLSSTIIMCSITLFFFLIGAIIFVGFWTNMIAIISFSMRFWLS